MSDEVKAPSLRQRLIPVLKWLWMLIVLSGFSVYIVQNYETIREQLALVSPVSIFIALILIAGGRLGIILMTREVLVSAGYPLPFKRLFYIFATSDLAKYLPGGIWHFVGRAGYYRSQNLPAVSIGQVILKENLWMIVSAGFSGSMLLVAGYLQAVSSAGVIALLAVIWWLVIYLWGRHVSPIRITFIIGLQFVTWLLVGLSFSVIVPIDYSTDTVILSAGAFTISWLIGFITLFAPGGIGVREAILVALMLPLLSATDSGVFAITHRILWIIVEFLFGLVAPIFFNIDRTEH